MAQEPVFSEQEASSIIQRAVEIAEQQSEPKYTSGVTSAELERIAKEIGVPPEALARAIQEAAKESKGKQPFRLTQDFERVVEGELDPNQYDLVVDGIKTVSRHGSPGMSQVGRTLSVSAWTGTGQAKVDLTSRNGRTKVKVHSNALLQALMTLHPAFMTSLISMGVLSDKGLPWLGAGIAVAAMSIGTVLFGWLTKKGHRKAELMADDLSRKVSEVLAASQPAASTSVPVEEPLSERLNQQS